MKELCGCCSGIRKLTPAATRNRPGLSALRYRAGTHGQFLQSMKARLSSLELVPEDFNDLPPDAIRELRPLLALTTRESRDPAIALLDAWALVADILTFYQERIANEGYLCTATERRSILELARLIGYRARPGVAASVYLAYTLEDAAQVVVPAGSRAQTVPGPGELPQPFETSNDLAARDVWNVLQPRITRPYAIAFDDADRLDAIHFKGVATRLKPGDPLLFVFSTADGRQVLRRVRTVEPDAAANRTRVTFVPAPTMPILGPPPMLDVAQDIALRFSDVQNFGVSPRGQAAKDTLARLEELQQLGEDDLRAELPRIIGELRGSQQLAAERQSKGVEPWIAEMVAELEEVQRATAVTPRSAPLEPAAVNNPPTVPVNTDLLIDALSIPPSIPPANAQRLPRTIAGTFAGTSDIGTRLLNVLRPSLGSSLYSALGNLPAPPATVQVYAFRVSAPLFGYNATPTRPRIVNDPRPLNDDQWHILDPIYSGGTLTSNNQQVISGQIIHEQADVVNLDAAYESILPQSFIVVQTVETPLTNEATLIGSVKSVRAGIGRGVYGVSGKTTRIELATPDGGSALNWLTGRLSLRIEPPPSVPPFFSLLSGDFDAIRSTAVYAQSELLELAERPCDPVAGAIRGNRIELAAFTGELEPGRWIIVRGERVDIPNVTGVFAAELAMIAGVEHGGDSKSTEARYSTLLLAENLAYRYRCDSVTIYGNVIHATHGETHEAALGSGDAGEPMQVMDVPEAPLTYLAAATPAGAESTLAVRVDGVLWREAESLLCAGPNDHLFITRTDDEDATTLVFGDGKAGARLPTGHENVRGLYRIGIGSVGNAAAGQISQLATREVGVKGVVNPLPATGGANREDRDQIRRNAPLAVAALDRLVSVRDYEDFARTFAGIAKASAARISDGRRQLVHVTIAGNDDVPIAESSDLFVNLRQALLKFGDPALPLRLAVRKLNALVISAKVRISPDYLWELVEPQIRAALLDAFSFTRRKLGRDAVSSEALSAIQSHPGVVYADLDIFDSVKETATRLELESLATTLQLRHRVRAPKAARATATGRKLTINPAELAYLTPKLPDTLILTDLKR